MITSLKKLTRFRKIEILVEQRLDFDHVTQLVRGLCTMESLVFLRADIRRRWKGIPEVKFDQLLINCICQLLLFCSKVSTHPTPTLCIHRLSTRIRSAVPPWLLPLLHHCKLPRHRTHPVLVDEVMLSEFSNPNFQERGREKLLLQEG